MKTEFKAKFLQHMVKKKQDQGFTLIELLVVIIIIGILSAIALPSFLNQANKAKQSEAKQNTGSMNRAQQAYYLENSDFASQVELLGLGITTQTLNYRYSINYTNLNSSVQVMGLSTKAALRSYAGRVELGSITATSEATTLAVLCETNVPASLSGTLAFVGHIADNGPSAACQAAGTGTNAMKLLDAK